MEDRNYFLKKYLSVLIVWAALSGFFSVFFIIAKADFESSYIKKMFLLIWIFELAAAAAFAFFTHGGFRLLFGIHIEHKDAFIINSFILNNHIDPKISERDLESLFYQLKQEGRTAFKKAVIYSFLVTIINVLVMSFVGTSTSNKLIILGGGFFGIIIFSLFSFFSADKFLRGLLKECRKLMNNRGITPDENIYFITIKGSFYYFIVLFMIITGVIMSFIPHFNFFVLILIFLGFVMVIIVARLLFSSIFSVFQEVKEFAAKLPRAEKAEYFTGSYYKESLELSHDLKKSADKIYESRELEKQLKEETEKRKNDLSKFYKLTVGRELKMIELKKEIGALKARLKVD